MVLSKEVEDELLNSGGRCRVSTEGCREPGIAAQRAGECLGPQQDEELLLGTVKLVHWKESSP